MPFSTWRCLARSRFEFFFIPNAICTILKHPQNHHIFMGWISAIPSHGRFMAVNPTARFQLDLRQHKRCRDCVHSCKRRRSEDMPCFGCLVESKTCILIPEYTWIFNHIILCLYELNDHIVSLSLSIYYIYTCKPYNIIHVICMYIYI
jgi:hypothetical protein